jgi:hypothetical protein
MRPDGIEDLPPVGNKTGVFCILEHKWMSEQWEYSTYTWIFLNVCIVLDLAGIQQGRRLLQKTNWPPLLSPPSFAPYTPPAQISTKDGARRVMRRKINEIIRYIVYRTTQGHLGTLSRTSYPTTLLVTSSEKTAPRRPDPGIRQRIYIDMIRPIRVDHTIFFQVDIKTHSFRSVGRLTSGVRHQIYPTSIRLDHITFWVT